MSPSSAISTSHFYTRRSLSLTLLTQPPPTSPPPPATTTTNVFDANVVMVLSVLLCALICSLGLNSIIRCAGRCSTLISRRHQSARLANTGIKRKALKTFPTLTYLPDMSLHTECVICLSEFVPGEKVRLLPKCHHGFHVRCIDKWLSSHSSCPTCRHCLIDTCRKIVGSRSSSEMVNIAPLEHEDYIRSYRGVG